MWTSYRVRYAIDNALILTFGELINMVLQTEKRYYTPEEYLELEEKAEYKNEYRNGEIIAITGSTTNHNKIALDFCKKFPTQKLKPHPRFTLWMKSAEFR